MNHLSDPGTLVEVFCTVETKDGAKQCLLNVAIQATSAGRMGVVAGAIGPEFCDIDQTALCDIPWPSGSARRPFSCAARRATSHRDLERKI